MIYKYTFSSVDYSKLAQYAYEYIKMLYTAEIKIAVLCGPDLSPRKVCDHLKIKKISSMLYDAGVEIFNTKINALGRASPPVLMPSKRKEKELATQQKDLGKWLQATSGILVTHESMFRGCEADVVVWVTRDWQDCNRSGVTRAVGHVCVITSDDLLNIKALRENWDVNIMEDGINDCSSSDDDSDNWEDFDHGDHGYRSFRKIKNLDNSSNSH